MTHIKDVESHIRSSFEDLEYWRAKRLEPRIFILVRKGLIGLADFATVGSSLSHDELHQSNYKPSDDAKNDLGERLEEIEIKIGEWIRGVQVTNSVIAEHVLVDESRAEAGAYDENLKFKHKELSGSVEERIQQIQDLLDEDNLLLTVYKRILVKNGFISNERLEELLAARVEPKYENGSMVVARAWMNSDFKKRLLNDTKGTLRELGLGLSRTPKLVVLENTESVHNVVVCTLCSCYPYELLGNPPWWYKHDDYKKSIIERPRKTLAEKFDLKIPDNVEVRVWDSTSDIRYMVMPNRPDGTRGLDERELSKLVSRESLIGVALAGEQKNLVFPVEK